MIKKLSSLSRKALIILLIVLIAVGAIIYFKGNGDNKTTKSEYPKYVNFDGNYAFSVPKDYTVDEQSVPGAQLVYTGTISAKTVEDVYNAGGISVYAISGLTDHSGKAFKDYVSKTFVEDLKKNVSPNNVKVKFGKANGADNARVTAIKDDKTIRFIYLKGGRYPAQVVAKNETSSVKRIAETMEDIESTNFKDEIEPIKQSIKEAAQMVKDQKATDLYSSASPELRAKTSQQELIEALKAATPFSTGNITVSGGSYKPNEFSAVLRFTSSNQDNSQPTFGSIMLKKSDGQWKMEALTLPTPKR